MIQTISVYAILTYVMYCLCKIGSKKGKWIYVIAAIVLYSIVFGGRYGVGVDFFGYQKFYDDLLNFGFVKQNWEVGFTSLSKFLASLQIPNEGFMFITSFIPICFNFRSIKNDKIVYRFFVLSFMLMTAWLSYCNGVRQSISVGFWLYSIRFIESKEVLKHYILIALAIAFHNSAWVLIIFYPIFNWRTEWFSNIKYQLVILFISLVLMQLSFVQNIVTQMESVLKMTGYGWYVDNASNQLIFEEDLKLGAGFVINLCRAIVFIVFSNKVKQWINSDFFSVIYDLYFIGVIVTYAFWGSSLIARLNWYFVLTAPIVGAYTLSYLYYNNRQYYMPTLLFVFFMNFVAIMYKAKETTAYFIFTWQDNLYYIKDFN